MSRTFITNIAHLLNETGTLSETLPRQAKALSAHVFTIVRAVTTQTTPPVKLTCWHMLARKRCGGAIDAGIDLSYFDIHWQCLKCGNNGSISHWEHTPWDGGHR